MMSGRKRYNLPFEERRQQPLHPRALELLGIIRAEPGLWFSELRRRIGAGNGSLGHHVRILGKRKLVRSETANGRTRFYPTESA